MHQATKMPGLGSILAGIALLVLCGCAIASAQPADLQSRETVEKAFYDYEQTVPSQKRS